MAIGKGGIEGRGSKIAGGNVFVKAAEAALEGVGKTFVVAARESRVMPRDFRQQRRVPNQALIGLITPTDPDFIGGFAVPGQGTLGAGNFVAQTVLAAGGDLGN